ncbi:MAG TPA: folate-binding protein [Stellaceae bacterium]|nr:folate-binding protein [Stellaceae bacterium]
MANFVVLEDRGILAVSGPDRRSFLQGLISNDIERVNGEEARYGALLTAQGRYLHDFVIADAGEAIWLDAEQARLADLKRRLAIYRLRARVALDERPDLAVAAAFGADAASAFGLPDRPGAACRFAGGLALVDPRLAALGVRVILPRHEMPGALAAHGLAAADFAAWDRLRLKHGVPDGSRDLIPDKSLLLESGFDELHGVDWQKGCYIGQELTARTKYRGLVKRRLFPVRIAGPPPAPGTPVTNDGREVGEMRSARDGLGLALLRLEAAGGDAQLTAGDATIAPTRPEWMRLDGDAPTAG